MSREFVSIDPCKHFTTLDREQLLTAHHLGWLLIDTESIFGIPLIRFEGKSIHRMGRIRRERERERERERKKERERDKFARFALLSAISDRDLLY